MTLLFKVEVSAFNIEKNHTVYTCKDVTDKVDVIQPYLEKNNVMMELLTPVRKKLPLIYLESEQGSSSDTDSPLGKRKLKAVGVDEVSTISPTKLSKQLVDVDIKKK